MSENKEIFHVHTFRCGHAENVSDEKYIKKAIELGANKITFTDHCPFPNNPFGNRMNIEQLPEYVSTLSYFKDKYRDRIKIVIGLEAEYLPSHMDYYKELLDTYGIEMLILGQHFYEERADDKIIYSFENLTEEKRNSLWIKMGESTIQGIKTGFFKVVAHPDRIFRMYDELNDDMRNLSKEIINVALNYGVLLEKNAASMRTPKYYKKEFWKMVPNNLIVEGLDAHSVKEIIL